MSVTIPGTNITVDHYKERTWREEFFTEVGHDYCIIFHREVVGYSAPIESEDNVVYRNRKGEEASSASAAGWASKVTVRLSDLQAAVSASIDLGAALVAADPSFDKDNISLSDIALIIVVSNEIVIQHNKQKRIAQWRLDNEADFDQADYDAVATNLIPTT